mgnify:CR=1 FL=1
MLKDSGQLQRSAGRRSAHVLKADEVAGKNDIAVHGRHAKRHVLIFEPGVPQAHPADELRILPRTACADVEVGGPYGPQFLFQSLKETQVQGPAQVQIETGAFVQRNSSAQRQLRALPHETYALRPEGAVLDCELDPLGVAQLVIQNFKARAVQFASHLESCGVIQLAFRLEPALERAAQFLQIEGCPAGEDSLEIQVLEFQRHPPRETGVCGYVRLDIEASEFRLDPGLSAENPFFKHDAAFAAADVPGAVAKRIKIKGPGERRIFHRSPDVSPRLKTPLDREGPLLHGRDLFQAQSFERRRHVELFA